MVKEDGLINHKKEVQQPDIVQMNSALCEFVSVQMGAAVCKVWQRNDVEH